MRCTVPPHHRDGVALEVTPEEFLEQRGRAGGRLRRLDDGRVACAQRGDERLEREGDRRVERRDDQADAIGLAVDRAPVPAAREPCRERRLDGRHPFVELVARIHDGAERHVELHVLLEPGGLEIQRQGVLERLSILRQHALESAELVEAPLPRARRAREKALVLQVEECAECGHGHPAVGVGAMDGAARTATLRRASRCRIRSWADGGLPLLETIRRGGDDDFTP